MKKLKYNIAENRKVDGLKFFIFSAAILLISLVFILTAMINLSKNQQIRQKDLKELDLLEQKLKEISEKSGEYEQKIKEVKSEWNSRVSLANSLIGRKKFSFIKHLDSLEKALPAGVFITNVSTSFDAKGRVSINIMSDSFPKLIEAYKSFSKFDLQVSNEAEVKGLYRANLTLNIGRQDEKK